METATHSWSIDTDSRGELLRLAIPFGVLSSAILLPLSLIEPWYAPVAVVKGFIIGTAFAKAVDMTVTLDRPAGELTIVREPGSNRGTTVTVDDLTGSYRLPVPIPGYRLFVCRRVRGGPFLLPVATAQVGPVENALDTGIRQDPVSSPRSAATTRSMRIVITAAGATFIAGAAALAVYTWDGSRFGARAMNILVMVGGLCLWYAGREHIRDRRDQNP